MTRALAKLPEVSGSGKDFTLMPFGEKARSFANREFPTKVGTFLSDMYRNTISYS